MDSTKHVTLEAERPASAEKKEYKDETPKEVRGRMATTPVNRLMLSMGIPMILSMMLQALYNIVDSAFVANIEGVGEQALNALTLAFPVQMLMVAVSIGTGVGVNALLSRSLGQGDRKRASLAAGNGIFLATIIYAVFLIFAFVGIDPYLRTQSANETILGMGHDYLLICCGLSFGIIYYSIFKKVLQGTGRSLYSTIAQVSGAIANIILDPIMIFGLLGFPEMGVRGAALATVVGQMLSLVIALIFHLRLDKEVDNGFKYMKPSKRVIGQIYSIGLPAIISQALMSFMTNFLNIILVQIGENVVTAYGLYYKIQQFILFAAFGLRDAITPIVSYSYGMGSKPRIKDGIRWGMIYTLLIMTAGFAALELFAGPIASVFGLSGETQKLCVAAIRIISFSFWFAGANIAFQGVFQALEYGMESLVISVCRQLLFVLPVAWALTRIILAGSAPAALVWITFPVAEGLSCLIAWFMMRRVNRKHGLV